MRRNLRVLWKWPQKQKVKRRPVKKQMLVRRKAGKVWKTEKMAGRLPEKE